MPINGGKRDFCHDGSYRSSPSHKFSLLHQGAKSEKHIHSLKVEEVVVGLRLVLEDGVDNGRRRFPVF